MIFQDHAAFAASGFVPQVCIIGSGPAGITVARKLAQSGIKSVVCEAGGVEYSEESQDAYKGRTIGDPYFDLDVTRLRHLGGSSNHWAGWCHLLEPYDFEPRADLGSDGWPIRRADIEPFLAETYDILGIPPFQPDRAISDVFRWFEVIKSEPVHFGEKFRDELETSATIAVLLNTTVTELAGDGHEITAARLRSNGVEGELRARHYVAATGGLENSRLLLWSNEKSNGGVVPHAEALGRYWMEHPMYWTGNALILNKAALLLDSFGESFLTPSKEALVAAGLPNFHIDLKTIPYYGLKHYVAEYACEYMPDVTEWIVSSLGKHLQCTARVHMAWEQLPHAHNRVTLSATERDAFGVPRIELHWTKDELDRRVMLEGMRMFGEDFARRNLGRVQISDWVLCGDEYPAEMELAGNHHMGGTRMSDDPRTGVVDRNSRVHGMRNLFVAGSSVYATGGQCTPTTTLVALAARLGDHIARTGGAS